MLRLDSGVTGTRDTYFVSFRAPVKFDAGMQPMYQYKVLVGATALVGGSHLC
jgi:hypothetical protein